MRASGILPHASTGSPPFDEVQAVNAWSTSISLSVSILAFASAYEQYQCLEDVSALAVTQGNETAE